MDRIMQGDSYGIPISIYADNGTLTPKDVSDVEIIIGSMRKTLSDGQILYDEEKSKFVFPITQEESFSLSTIPQKIQIRCKFHNGEVIGKKLGTIDVTSSVSKVVL